MNNHYFIFIALFFFGCSPKIKEQNQIITFKEIKCNELNNPLGLDVAQPTFSWEVEALGENKSQSAYQIIVASSPENLNIDDADVWNEGKKMTDRSSYIKYDGVPLQAFQKYWWKVKIWDEKGKASEWSPIGTFEMGLMNQEDWGESKWLSVVDNRTSEYQPRAYKTGKMKSPIMVKSQAAGYFRKVIDTEKEIKSARAYVCGLGYYELYINGDKIGDHVLDPAPSNYDQQAYYVSYDITKNLKEGQNTLGTIVGNGFYGQNISWKRDPESERDLSYGKPCFRLLIDVKYNNNTQSSFYSDESWKATTGPIVFDNIYGGETYDARFELTNWNTIQYNDEEWSSVNIEQPKIKKINAQLMPPIRSLKDLAAQRIFKAPDGNWIVDFGQNVAGWVNIKLSEDKGKRIDIVLTEALTQDGKDIYLGSTGGGANGLKQHLIYISNGEKNQQWSPKFTYHGFRYAKISGLKNKPSLNSIKAELVATDIKEKGSFSCSDSLLNKMHEISKWTIVDNIHGIPEDCPHREKCGWLGDAHAFCEYALYNYEMDYFYKKYMIDIRTQRKKTKGHHKEKEYLVPTMIAPGKRTSTIAKLDWGIAGIYLPWYNYLYYGDSAIVIEYYEDMKELTNYYLSFKNDIGIIDNGMGDWCPPLWDRKRNPTAMECDPVISANAYFYDILHIMQKMAILVDDKQYATLMANEYQQLGEAFNLEYLKENDKYLWYGSQTATVMALQFDMVPKEKIKAVIDGLEHNIVVEKSGHHSTGIHGNRYIYSVLSKHGKSDLAYDILTVPTFPSQTYVMNYGFTTWPERQFEWEKMPGLSNSLNHPMHSGFSAYFFESIGGLKPTFEQAGYKEFIVDPTFPTSITHADVTVSTRYGKVENKWEMKGGILTMDLKIPFNTKAKIVLSEEEKQSLLIYKQDGSQVKNLTLDYNNLILGSGQYLIKYKKQTDTLL
ncbi:glycoside hydrolase family 78 protein [Flammeovirga yaeyamensis]|uniref:alpha-L-rhamnosidase n=1 Tax=Flammeovirga yaeyamensis TaxID=367791 RepID=A0AAX1NF37_9BACT|nr:family 78 glycoside hydrolase catalytic domain [Flammeovirga yaeyamensis]MBB3696628.1 alpha-L-rhamnosidase [Flammeovirga yaeyamensis]NMF33301.1 family 78 glycoside hydrolase catalytic domain [Flammeovirga yaeyamensis]QWG05420.1 glycoside hydrolase family 78 protein [Flammeovirga yaeyamensis]